MDVATAVYVGVCVFTGGTFSLLGWVLVSLWRQKVLLIREAKIREDTIKRLGVALMVDAARFREDPATHCFACLLSTSLSTHAHFDPNTLYERWKKERDRLWEVRIGANWSQAEKTAALAMLQQRVDRLVSLTHSPATNVFESK